MKSILSKIPIISKMVESKELSEKTVKEYKSKVKAVKKAQEETYSALELLGRVKGDVVQNILDPFKEQLSRVEDVTLVDTYQKTETAFEEKKSKSKRKRVTKEEEKDKTLIATITAGGAGAGAAAAAYASAGAFASASTGTAIATLSGAAASKATLAFLGGGALSAGGVGIAGGVAVLGGLVAVPTLLVGGFFFDQKANNDLKKAKEDHKKVKQFIKESDQAIEEMNKIKDVSIELHQVLVPLASEVSQELQTITDIINRNSDKNIFLQLYYSSKKGIAFLISKIGLDAPDWLLSEPPIKVSKFNARDKTKVYDILTKVQMLKDVLDVNIINDTGVVAEETRSLIKTIEESLGQAPSTI
jgi:hypothetical protein